MRTILLIVAAGLIFTSPVRGQEAVAILSNLEGVPGRTELSANIAKVVLGLGT